MTIDPLDTENTMTCGPDKSGGYTLSSGDALGQYKIIRPLGRGGMGEVYEAEHRTLERRYALKLLPASLDSQGISLERFKREAKVMANLEHPNILKVDEFGETNGRFWLRMELADGVKAEIGGRTAEVGISLDDLAKAHGGTLPQGLLLPILRQVLEGLVYAHGRGAVHRDLKPSNILLLPGEGDNPFLVKIADFGLVRLVGEEWVRSQVQLSVQRSMGEVRTMVDQSESGEGTSTRSMLGTFEYMSPEQKRGEDADARSDLYAVGVMAYRLLTGRNIGPKLPSRIDRELVDGWDDFVEQALEEDPAERLSDAAAGLGLLAEIGKQLSAAMHDQQAGDKSRAVEERERFDRVQQEAEERRKADLRQREDGRLKSVAEGAARRKREMRQAEEVAKVPPPAKKKSGVGKKLVIALFVVWGVA